MDSENKEVSIQDIIDILESFKENCTVNITELGEKDTVNLKFLNFAAGTEEAKEATEKVHELSINTREDILDIMTMVYGKLFKNDTPGYSCRITLNQLTSHTTNRGRKLTTVFLNDIARFIYKEEIPRLIIKKCFNIDNYETIYNELEVEAISSYMTQLGDAEFVSGSSRILISRCRSRLDENGYTLVFDTVIE